MTETLESLASRLNQLEDERAVLQTLYAYGHSIDYGDERRWLGCFTDDGVFEVRYRSDPDRKARRVGQAELAAFVARHTRPPAAYHKHIVAEPDIAIDGDTATAVSYFIRVDTGDGGTYVRNMGRYRDRLVRCADGRWRFEERIAEVEDA